MGKHKVKKGETLSKIAKSYGLSLQELLDLNGISADKANHITIGQELVTDKNMGLPDFSKFFKLSGFTPYESSTAEAVIPYTPRSKEENDTILLQRQLQAKGYDLGKYGVDGKMGKATKAALQQAMADGLVYKNGELVSKESKSSVPEESRSSVPMYGVHPMFGFTMPSPEKKENSSSWLHTTSNNPIGAALEDLAVSSINNVYRQITGNDDYILASRDITEIPEDQKQVLRQLYNYKGGKGNIPWTSADYKKYQGTYTGGNRSLAERAFTPIGAIEHTLGQLNFIKDPDTGDVYMQDTYDWNTGESSQNQGWYTAARDFMGKYGTKDTDPEEQKKHYKVNLGNPKDWKFN